jgi:hypothetical protein
MITLLSTAVAIAVLGISTGNARITGQIPCAGRLEFAERSVQALGPGQSARLRLRPEGENAVVRMLVRCNCAYHLDAQVAGTGERQLRIISVSASPWSGTGHLRPGATAGQLQTSAVTPLGGTFWSGPAVSKGGNNSTPDNAVLVQSVLSPAEPGGEIELLLSFWLD